MTKRPLKGSSAEKRARPASAITVLRLNNSDEEWAKLLTAMSSPTDAHVASSIVKRLRHGKVQSAIIEHDYLDRDFSAEYSAFYSKLFVRYKRQTRRVHFFRSTMPPMAPLKLRERLGKLPRHGEGDYVGFVVLRPVADAPVGRTVLDSDVLRPVANPLVEHSVLDLDHIEADTEQVLCVRSTYVVHLLGVELKVCGLPFMQQDSRVSACAQTSIWTCGRHFENEHRGPWKSTVDITADATFPADGRTAATVPVGGEALGDDHIVRALAALQRQPLSYLKEGDRGRLDWTKTIDPAAVITRYVLSGIPVILGLDGNQGQLDKQPAKEQRELGHAVVAHGYVLKPDKKLPDPLTLPEVPNHDWSKLITHFIVHDDQRGPNLFLPLKGRSPILGFGLEDCSSILVALPDKVFVSGEAVEIVAWLYLQQLYAANWRAYRLNSQFKNIEVGDRAVDAINSHQVVASTALMMGWRYKNRLLKSGATRPVLSNILTMQLPRLVWVTEFAIVDDLKYPQNERKIFSHVVTDATVTGPDRRPLVFHAPNFLQLNIPVEPRGTERLRTYEYNLPSDGYYAPLKRQIEEGER